MTQAEILAMARQFARMSTSGISDTNANLIIEQAHSEVARDLNGIPKRSYVQIGAVFYISTDMAARFTITGGANALAATDVHISSTAIEGGSGSDVATALQAALWTAIGAGADLTVTFTNYYFTIETDISSPSTEITIEPPSDTDHSDATGLLFGGADQTQTDHVWTGSFPEDCTIEASLPSDFHQIEQVHWGTYPLSPAPRDYFVRPGALGDPSYYNIRGDKLYLYPTPTSQDVCYIEYTSVPVPTYFTTTTYAPDMPARYHMLLVYLTAYYMLVSSHEMQLANQMYGKYIREKNRALINKQNGNTAMDAGTEIYHPYKVIV